MAGRESGQPGGEKDFSMVGSSKPTTPNCWVARPESSKGVPPTDIFGAVNVLEPAAARTARRQFRIALSWQRRGLIDRFGRHAQEAFEFVTVAFGAVHLFAIEDQGLEGVIALPAFEFVHRHFQSLPCFIFIRTRTGETEKTERDFLSPFSPFLLLAQTETIQVFFRL